MKRLTDDCHLSWPNCRLMPVHSKYLFTFPLLSVVTTPSTPFPSSHPTNNAYTFPSSSHTQPSTQQYFNSINDLINASINASNSRDKLQSTAVQTTTWTAKTALTSMKPKPCASQNWLMDVWLTVLEFSCMLFPTLWRHWVTPLAHACTMWARIRLKTWLDYFRTNSCTSVLNSHRKKNGWGEKESLIMINYSA